MRKGQLLQRPRMHVDQHKGRRTRWPLGLILTGRDGKRFGSIQADEDARLVLSRYAGSGCGRRVEARGWRVGRGARQEVRTTPAATAAAAAATGTGSRTHARSWLCAEKWGSQIPCGGIDGGSDVQTRVECARGGATGALGLLFTQARVEVEVGEIALPDRAH